MKAHTPSKSKTAAFTLIELLACIAVIAILASLIYGGIARVRISANKANGTATMRSIGIAIGLYQQDKKAMPGPTFLLQNALYNGKWGLVNYLAPYLGAPNEPTNTIQDSFVPLPFLDYVKTEGNEQTILYEANQEKVGVGPSGHSQSIWAHISAVQSQSEDETPISPFNIYYIQETLNLNNFWILHTSFVDSRSHPDAQDIYDGERVILYLDGHVEMAEDVE